MKIFSILLALGTVFVLAGCSGEAAPPAPSVSAPAPKNLSPEEQKAYEDAQKNVAPSASAPAPGK